MSKHREHDEQAAVIQWRDWQSRLVPELSLLHAIPNGAHYGGEIVHTARGSVKRAVLEHNRLVREGLLNGIPDLFLPCARRGFHGLYIEMKHGKGKPSPEQAAIIDRLAEQGYCTVVCWSSAEAIDNLKWYLSLA